MKYRSIYLFVGILTLCIGLSTRILWNAYPAPAELPSLNLTTLVAPNKDTINYLIPPPPPPRPISVLSYQQPSEQALTLTGTSSDQLRRIEQYLPEGARIATYPVSMAQQKAALANTDLINDGNIKTILIYEMHTPADVETDTQLFLGILVHAKGGSLTLRSSAHLYGGLIYTSIYDKHSVPFAIRDVTGDGHKQIIVTSGVGASIGGALQIFSFNGSTLEQLANISGHTLRLYDEEAKMPVKITAQSRYEAGIRVYRWNNRKFEQSK